MEKQLNYSSEIRKIGALSGVISIVFYFSAAVVSFLPDAVTLLFGFSFPLLWIISFMGLYDLLKSRRDSAILRIACLFGIIGSTIAASFIVVQQANFIWHGAAMDAAGSEQLEALARAAFKGANRVQAGLDVSFDIFITIAWFLLGLIIAKDPRFNKFFGWLGSAIALSLLVLNMITFPDPPASSGLIDLGPLMGLWALAAYIWFAVIVFRKR